MFIHTQITEEIAAKHGSDAADIVVYIPVDVNGRVDPNNISSLCIWIVPNTQIND